MKSAKTIAYYACLSFTPLLIAVPAFGQEVVYRLNAGGSWYTDSAAQDWEPDSAYRDYGYIGVTSAPIGGTLDDKLYQSERWGAAWQPELAYHLPVLPGAYTVRLHFAEIYDGITPENPRVFDVLLEGVPALENYSILNVAGFATAIVEEFEVVVNDTELDIEFVRQQENPKISALEVLTSVGPQPGPQLSVSPQQLVFGDVTVGSTAEDSVTLANSGDANLEITAITLGGTSPAAFSIVPLTLPLTLVPGQTVPLEATFSPAVEGPVSAVVTIDSNDPAGTKNLPLSGVGVDQQSVTVWRVNAGGSSYTDPQGNAWQSDAGLFNTGSTFSTTQSISETAADPLYQSERYDAEYLPEMVYSIPVESGSYTLNLHFADIYFTSPGQRVFDVAVEGETVLSDFDIVGEAGPFAALVKTFQVDVLDDSLDIQFIHVVENPKISAIEILTEAAVLFVNPASVNFGTVALGDTSPVTPITINNNSELACQLESLTITGANVGDFALADVPAMPAEIGADGNLTFGASFTPLAAGLRTAAIEIGISGGRQLVVPLTGTGEASQPPTGAIYRVNAGGPAYTDSSGNLWESDASFYNIGYPYSVSSPIAGTMEDGLYQTERWSSLSDPNMVYSFPLAPGSYVVRLHFAEIYDGIAGSGDRVFNVFLEDQPVLSSFDIFAEAGFLTALVKEFDVSVEDGALQVRFEHGVENPKISAIEVLGTSAITPSVSTLNWGQVLLNTSGGLKNFTLTNMGDAPVNIDNVGFYIGSGTGQGFVATIDGTPYNGASTDIVYPINLDLDAGASVPVSVNFTPTTESANDISLTFSGTFGSVSVQLLGTGVDDIQDPYLHVIIKIPSYFIDYDMDELEEVWLQGDESYTSEPGHSIVAWEWSIDGVPFANTPNTSHVFALGDTTLKLTIWDDSTPPRSLSGTSVMHIVPGNGIPGSMVFFYESANPTNLLDAVLPPASYATKYSSMYLAEVDGVMLNTPYTGNVMAKFMAQVDISDASTYDFVTSGGSDSRFYFEGAPVTGPMSLSPGRYAVEARFAVPNLGYLPGSAMWSKNGGPFELIPPEVTTHSQLGMKPVINELTPEGGAAGGYTVLIYGAGYIPLDQIVVHWGETTLPNEMLIVQSSAIRFIAPPGTGTINVSVENPYGVSNVRTFTYLSK